ncbi:Stage V sporulation protein T [Moorella thermoacetica]|uniref:Stage V sporulation protein T n=1 Tax=Neomoorella thermoacetica TaxID=1525 RepID=A0AAC9HIM6_NEOTH|nr:AbrB/MazE/SpoVT family DNA-binding domain-containing protein [Moorella thermoacetica]AOQ24580.1 Stage V sporulation protein T [Moorella thermoacetica]TYL12681.1 Stage V sporulation protein T [Moorella thermoacetica]
MGDKIITNVVKRIDSAGRIMLPPELRENLSLNTGDEVQFFLDTDGYIALRPYVALDDLSGVGQLIIKTMNRMLGMSILLARRDMIVAVAGAPTTMLGRVPARYIMEAINHAKIIRRDDRLAVPINNGTGPIGALAGYLSEGVVNDIQYEIFRFAADFLAEYYNN